MDNNNDKLIYKFLRESNRIVFERYLAKERERSLILSRRKANVKGTD